MPFYYPLVDPGLLHGKTLIIPVVSVANVSQLAVDLLVATLNLQRLGCFDARDLVPVIGGREDGEDGLTTPLELYGRKGVDVVMIQQRSPALKARKETFTNSLLAFVREYQLSAILLLSGVDLSHRTDSQMRTPTYLVLPPNQPIGSTPLSALTALPEYNFSYNSASTRAPGIPFIPGGGLSRRLLNSLPAGWSIPTACVLQFVLEGDNRADAAVLADAIVNLIGLTGSFGEWKQPSSWKEGLFGTPHDQTLFG